jgi:hypothetical protein
MGRAVLRGTIGVVALCLLLPAAAAGGKRKPKPSLRINNAPVVTEFFNGSGPQKFTVKLSRKAPRKISFQYATYDGTADSVDDYTAKSGTRTIARGKRSVRLTITVGNDLFPEPTEAYGVRISNPTGAKLSDHKTASGRIKDDDHIEESEPNGTTASATPLGDERYVSGRQAIGADVDLFKLVTTDTDSLFVSVLPWNDFSCEPGPGEIDTVVRILESDGTTVLDTDDNGGDGKCSEATALGQPAGTYYIEVTQGFDDAFFDYLLDVVHF